MNGPVFFTDRLILRPPVPEDFEPFAAFHAEEDTMTYLGGVQPRSTAWRNFCGFVGAWHVRGYAMFSVIERDSGAWVGRVGTHYPEGWPGREVGWGVARAFAGKGYAFDAACVAMDFAVDLLGWDEVIHCIAPENARSIALAKRLGSALIGPTELPPPVEPGLRIDNWGQSAAQWRAQRARVRQGG